MKKFFLFFILFSCGTTACDLVEVIVTNEQLTPDKFDKLLDVQYRSKKPLKMSFSESDVSDSHLAQLLRLQDHLIDLDLSGCKNISNEQIKLLVISLSELKTLNIARTNIEDEALATISKLPKLQSLNLEQCSITNKGLESLPTSLEELNISDIEKITSKGLGHLRSLKKLKKLHVYECPNITNNGIRAMLEKVSTLEYLDVSLSKKITVDIFKHLSNAVNKRIMTHNKTNFSCTITDEIDFTTEKFQPNKVILSHEDRPIFTFVHNGFDSTDQGAEHILAKNIQYFTEIDMSRCEQITNKIFKIISDSLHKNNVSDKIFGCKTTKRKVTYFDKNNQIFLRIFLPQLEIAPHEVDSIVEHTTQHLTNLNTLKIPSYLKTNNKTVKKVLAQNKNLHTFNFYPAREEIESIVQTIVDTFEVIGCEIREERLVHSFTLYNKNQQKKAILQLQLQPDGVDMEKFLAQITPPLEKKLQALTIHRSAAAGSLKPIAKFTNLKKLDIAYYAKEQGLKQVKLNDEEFAHIQNLSALEELNIEGTMVTDQTLALIAAKFPKLRRLNAKETKIQKNGVNALKKALPNVEIDR